jgi:hypothetical protein
VNLQFRIDAFNAFNHPNFRGDQINTDWGAATTSLCGGVQCAAGNTTVTSTTVNPVNQFGKATGDIGPRQFQYGLRLTF